MVGTETGNWKDLIKLNSNERRKEWKKISSSDGEADEEYFWYGGLEDEETTSECVSYRFVFNSF